MLLTIIDVLCITDLERHGSRFNRQRTRGICNRIVNRNPGCNCLIIPRALADIRNRRSSSQRGLDRSLVRGKSAVDGIRTIQRCSVIRLAVGLRCNRQGQRVINRDDILPLVRCDRDRLAGIIAVHRQVEALVGSGGGGGHRGIKFGAASIIRFDLDRCALQIVVDSIGIFILRPDTREFHIFCGHGQRAAVIRLVVIGPTGKGIAFLGRLYGDVDRITHMGRIHARRNRITSRDLAGHSIGHRIVDRLEVRGISPRGPQTVRSRIILLSRRERACGTTPCIIHIYRPVGELIAYSLYSGYGLRSFASNYFYIAVRWTYIPQRIIL